jgi:hypothetical protein
MNDQPIHDSAMGDLRGNKQLVMTPDDINIGDIPNTDTATNDMRGYEPPPETDPEADNTKKIVGAVVVAAVLGGLGFFSYSAGLWNSAPAPQVSHVLATTTVAPAAPAVVPQQAAVAPVAPPAATAPVDAVPQQAPVIAVKRSAAPNKIPAMKAQPKPVVLVPSPPVVVPQTVAPQTTAPETALPEVMPPVNSVPAPEPLVPAPVVPTPTEQPSAAPASPPVTSTESPQ